MSLAKDFTNGIIRQNPTFVLMLGMCPVLAVTNNAINGFSMGAATLFVLACSNMVISLIRHLVPKTVRIHATSSSSPPSSQSLICSWRPMSRPFIKRSVFSFR